ncbi:MAG: hypothetical protein IJ785_01105 [Bacteroidales bacterium]|nr:hypothetical protein [Bacteroidales bacterium]
MKKNYHLQKLLRTTLFVVMVFLLFPNQSMSQNSREYIRSAIREKGQCRNVAITRYGGDLMLYGKNGYAYKGIPYDLASKIDQLHDESKFIDDIQLTEGGRWLILIGNNGASWNNIPYGLEQKLREYNSRDEVITSIAMNDDGDWVVVGTTIFATSSSAITQWLKEGMDSYGQLWTVHMTDDAIVAVYERGFKYYGEVPYSLKSALKEVTFNVYRLKFAGTAWFIADKSGNYRYNM